MHWRKKESESSIPINSTSDFVFVRVLFSLVGILSGLFYAVIFLIFMYLFHGKIEPHKVLKSFSFIFGFAGLILGESITPIVKSTFYGLMYLWGFIVGAIGLEGSIQISESMMPQKKSYVICFMLGVCSACVAILIL